MKCMRCEAVVPAPLNGRPVKCRCGLTLVSTEHSYRPANNVAIGDLGDGNFRTMPADTSEGSWHG